MARDPVRVVQALRQRMVEQARNALGACLRSEADKAARIEAIDAAAARDRVAFKPTVSGPAEAGQDAAQLADVGLQFQDMFARRILARRAEREAAQADLLAAETRSVQARAAVTAARTAAEAVETLIAERTAAAAVETARREQHVMDDIARTRGGTALR